MPRSLFPFRWVPSRSPRRSLLSFPHQMRSEPSPMEGLAHCVRPGSADPPAGPSSSKSAMLDSDAPMGGGGGVPYKPGLAAPEVLKLHDAARRARASAAWLDTVVAAPPYAPPPPGSLKPRSVLKLRSPPCAGP
eukprot:scaffold11642_cov103-Isochrysis_galbana.AAC.4